MKADLTTQHYPVRETLPDLRRLAEPLENLDAVRYNRRTWRHVPSRITTRSGGV